MKLLQLLSVNEQDIVDADDDYDNGSYEREKKVSVLILRAFRKCGLSVTESDKSYGTRDTNDLYKYDVVYIDDDREASVTVDDVELSQLIKLNDSGLIDGKCTVTPTSDQVIRLTFKVHPAIAKGDAHIE